MSTATRRAIYGRMAGDTTLNSLLGTPAAGYSKSIYDAVAPEGAPFPFVVFHKQSGLPTQAFGDPSALETDVWLIKAVDRSDSGDTAEAISARVTALMNDGVLSISGAVLLFLRRQSDAATYTEVIDGVQHRHVGCLYRLVSSD